MSCEYLGVIQFSSIWSAFSLQPHILCWHVRYGPCALFPPKAKNDFSRKKHWGSSDFAAHVLFNWLPATFEVQLFEVQSKHMLCLLKYTYHEKRDWDDTTCFLVQFVPYSLSYLFHIYWTEQGIRSIPYGTGRRTMFTWHPGFWCTPLWVDPWWKNWNPPPPLCQCQKKDTLSGYLRG